MFVHSMLAWWADDDTGMGMVPLANIAAGVGMTVEQLENGPLHDLAMSRDVIFYECPEGMVSYFLLKIMSRMHGIHYKVPEDRRGKMPKRLPARDKHPTDD